MVFSIPLICDKWFVHWQMYVTVFHCYITTRSSMTSPLIVYPNLSQAFLDLSRSLTHLWWTHLLRMHDLSYAIVTSSDVLGIKSPVQLKLILETSERRQWTHWLGIPVDITFSTDECNQKHHNIGIIQKWRGSGGCTCRSQISFSPSDQSIHW